jgi:hypothetical protein
MNSPVVGPGQLFMKEIVNDTIVEAGAVFVGCKMCDSLHAELILSVNRHLSRTLGIPDGLVSVTTARSPINPNLIDIMPGNLYTYLLMEGIRVDDLDQTAVSHKTMAGTYCFAPGRGGWLVK